MEKLRQQIITQQRRIRDLLDSPNDPAARALQREVQALEDDMQSGKRPASLESRVVRITQIITGDARRNRIMNYEHLDMLEQWFMDLRNTLRKM